MSMNFIEPEIQQTVSIFDVLENLAVSYENKEWLSSLFLKNIELHPDFEDNLSNFINKINKEDSDDFRLLFLFDFCVSNPDCFDENKLKPERIKIIPSLFTQAAEGKPSVFKPYIANILNNIRDIEKSDSTFSFAYGKKKQEVREASSLAQRICCYIKLLDLSKRTYETGEKPATPDEISSLFSNTEEKYSMRLIAELEEIDVLRDGSNIEIISLPFLLYGKELFTCLGNALFLGCLMALPHKGNPDNLIEKIKIPQWDNKNHFHKNFFYLAKDLSNMSIIDRIFEGIDSANIPNVFFNHYILEPNRSFFEILLNGEYSRQLKPIWEELKYLDWSLTPPLKEENKHQIYFEKCQFFLTYLKYLANKSLYHKIALFRELSFLKHGNFTIRDVLDSIAREREITDNDGSSYTIPNHQKEADALYEEFVDVIVQGAAAYPVVTFLSLEQIQAIDTYDYSEYELKIFKRYCGKIRLESPEEALLIGQFWFIKFHYREISYDLLLKQEEFIYKYIFHPFSDNEEFVYEFLSISQKSFSNHYNANSVYWALYYLACWIVKYDKKPDDLDIFKTASELLVREKIIFPVKIVKFILSNIDFDRTVKEIIDRFRKPNEADLLLCKVLTAIDENEKYKGILEFFHEPEEQFPLYFIRYNYSHDKFVQEEFLDFLLNLKNPNPTPNWIEIENKIYNLELIQKACIEKILEKQNVLEKVCDYINKNCKELFKFSKIKSLISYFFIETEKGKNLDAQTVFFMRFCELAVQENDDSYEELYWFLKIRSYFNNKTDEILEKHKEINDSLTTRCCKMLNNLKKNIEQKKFPNDEYTFLNDYILPASDFVWEKTGNIWKALKPLILSLRASKEILLSESLGITDNLSDLFLSMITSFFGIEDKERIKELRYDMANDFAEYLKPAKNERQVEKYTQTERETEGFDLSYTEPSPYWRYAYVRALGDLGIKTDRRGHYFHKILENVSEKDPSEDVRTAAKKVMNELDSIRTGYSGSNHKKCLFEAFWWLKQAHIFSLGGKVDSKKANDLRIKEWW